MRPVLLFGASGLLGAPLVRRMAVNGRVVHAIPWREASGWLEPADSARIRERVAPLAEGGLDVLFTGGLTDPVQPAALLSASNRLFPQRVIDATRRLGDVRWVTLGTVLERFDALAATNAYIASKRALAAWVDEVGAADLAGRIVHLQLHTLYGGSAPAPHMFMGQLVEALRHGRPFAMSSGLQLREYHHVDDVAGSIARLLARPFATDPVTSLSSGRPVRLADLARAVFAAVDREADLRIGALPDPAAENLAVRFAPSPRWLLGVPRDQISGVCAWVRELLLQADTGVGARG